MEQGGKHSVSFGVLLSEVILEQASPRDRHANLSILSAMSFLRGAHTSLYNVIWQPFVLSLGASMPVVGLLASLGGTGGLVPTLVQPLGGWFADRLGRKPFILAASVVLIGGYALFALAGFLNLWALLLLGVIVIGISALSRPATQSMTAESVRTERHATAFSLITLTAMAPGIIVPALGGALADRVGYVSIFPIAMVLEGLALGLAWRYLRETHASPAGGMDWRAGARALLRSVVPPRGLLPFFCAVAGDSLSWSTGWALLNGMLTETFHFTVEQLGIMTAIMSLSWAIMQMPIGRYVDRRGTRAMLVFSESIGIPLLLIWLTQTRFEVFAASQVLFALTAATWVPITSTYLSRAVSASERAETFGRLSAFRGLIAVPGSTIGGLLYAWGGMRAPLAANLIGVCVVVAILALFVHEPKSATGAVPND